MDLFPKTDLYADEEVGGTATTIGNARVEGYGFRNLYRYDARNHLTNLVWAKAGSVVAGFGYNLGPTGNRLGLSETNNGNVRN